MLCPNCGKEIDENSDYCFYCGKKVKDAEIDQSPLNNSTTTKQPILIENYKKHFNIWFYVVTAFLVLMIFVFSGSPANLLGNIGQIILNPFAALFYVFISIFKKSHKKRDLILSIVFGSIIMFSAFITNFVTPIFNAIYY